MVVIHIGGLITPLITLDPEAPKPLNSILEDL